MRTTKLLAAVAPLAAVLYGQPSTKLPYTVERLLVVGDSITKHGPAEKLGWQGNWGMAASSAEADFAHLLAARITREQGKPVELLVHAVGGGTLVGKIKDTTNLSAMKADLIVVQMGENDGQAIRDGLFQSQYEQVLAILKAANPAARIVCTGVWGKAPGTDRMVRSACRKFRLPFADLSKAQENEATWARSTGKWSHPGVGWHPSDAGMTAYAEAIYGALLKGDAAIPAPEAETVAAAQASSVVLLEDFENAASLSNWMGAFAREQVGGKWCLRITNGDAKATVSAAFKLPAGALSGKTVTVSARVRGAGISQPPKSYNGVKVMLALVDAEGAKDWPQAPAPTGDFDFKTLTFSKAVHPNLAVATLTLGLELVTGSIWIDEVKISVESAPAPAKPQ